MKSTRAIRMKVETPEEINEVFDGIAYEKTAAVLRMIEKYVGRTFARVSPRIKKYSYSNAAGEDFWNEVARVTGQAGRSHHAQLRGPGRRAGADRPQLVLAEHQRTRREGRPLHGHARLVTGSADVDAARGAEGANGQTSTS